MSERAPANLPRSLLNFALTMIAFALAIVTTVTILHTPTVSIADLVMFLPSAVLILTPYLTNVIEAALGLSEFASITFGLLMASLCTGLYAFNFDPLAPGLANPDHGEIRSSVHTAYGGAISIESWPRPATDPRD